MATNVGTVSTELTLDTRKASQQYRRFSQEMGRANRNINGLGSITQDARKFESALGAATNRVTAFAAAAVVFNTVKNAVSAFASAVVDVDKSLAQINVNLGQSAEGLKKFGADLFSVARQTGQTFEVAAKAAEELARQGLGAVETTKRLKDALILSRIAGISSADAVETLTAAINSFNKSALTSSEVVNKFAAVDTRFAVSSKDLAEAISRVGSTAQSAGVGIDELIGLVTSLQQTTARGGATIGNGLKTIFTRIQAAPETISALQSLGVSIKYSNGELRSAVDILRDYAKARESVGEAERASLDRTIAGTFQVNILKAAIGDLSSQYSTYDNALRTSNNAVDEAIVKNTQLNQTLSALINSTSASMKQFFSALGEQSLAPVLKQLLGGFEKIRGYLSGDTGNSIGKSLGEGILGGLTNVLTGPVFVGLAAILGKAFFKIASTIKQEAQSLISINNTAEARAKIQTRINELLSQATAQEYAQYRAANTVLAQKQAILQIQERIASLEIAGSPLVNSFLTKNQLTRKVSISGLGAGRLPGFADPIASAIARESKSSGLPTSQIYVDRDSRVANFANPAGILIANRRDEPAGGFQGVNRVLAMGGNPKTNGVPNFATPPFSSGELRTKGGQYAEASVVNALFENYRKAKPLSREFERLGTAIIKFTAQLNKASEKKVLERQSQESNLAYIRSKIIDDNSRRVGYTAPSGVGARIDQSRAIFDQNILRAQVGASLPNAAPLNNRDAYRRAQVNARRNQNLQLFGVEEPNRAAQFGVMNERQTALRGALQQNIAERNAVKASNANQLKMARAEQLKQRNANRALYGGFALSFATGFIPEGEGGTSAGIGYGAARGAGVGAGLGAIAGPTGLAAGAAVGALIGAFSKLKKSAEELSQEFSKGSADRAQENDAISRVISLRGELEEAQKREEPEDVINKIKTQILEVTNAVSSSRGKEILDVNNPYDRNKLIEQKRKEDLRQNTFGLATTQLAKGEIKDLPKIFGQGMTAEFIRGINSKDLGQLVGKVLERSNTPQSKKYKAGGAFLETEGNNDFNKLVGELTPFIGEFIDTSKLNEDNLKDVVTSFANAVENFKTIAAKLDKQRSVPRGLPTDAFLSAPNLESYRRAGSTAANRYTPPSQRAEAQFGFFNELISAGGTSQAVVEGEPVYKQARTLTARKNVLEGSVSYLQGRSDLNINTSLLRNNEGEINGPALQKLLAQLGRTVKKDSPQLNLLAKLVERAEASVEESGYKRAPQVMDGLVPGEKYSTYAPLTGGKLSRFKKSATYDRPDYRISTGDPSRPYTNTNISTSGRTNTNIITRGGSLPSDTLEALNGGHSGLNVNRLATFKEFEKNSKRENLLFGLKRSVLQTSAQDGSIMDVWGQKAGERVSDNITQKATEAEKKANDTIKALNDATVKAEIKVDGTIKVISDTMPEVMDKLPTFIFKRVKEMIEEAIKAKDKPMPPKTITPFGLPVT